MNYRGPVAIALRDNGGDPVMRDWRYEVRFAKMSYSVMAFDYSMSENTNRARVSEWCDDAGITDYRFFLSGVGFPNRDDQILCYLAFK